MRTRLVLFAVLLTSLIFVDTGQQPPSPASLKASELTPPAPLSQASLARITAVHSLIEGHPGPNPPNENQQPLDIESPGSIIGTDDRKRIIPTTTPPWSGIVSLDITINGQSVSCTGFFISPRLIATAGHCVYYGGWATSVRVIPGRNAVDEPFGSQYAITLYTNTLWIEDTDPAMDFGAVKLPDDTLGNQVGWFGYGSFNDRSLIGLAPQVMGNIAGYPGTEPVQYDCPKEDEGFVACQLWFHYGEIPVASYSERTVCPGYPDPCTTITKGLLNYNIDTSAGQSGSPVWLYSGIQRVVAGIHTNGADGSVCAEANGPLNCGTLITPTVAGLFEYWGSAPFVPIIFTPFQAEEPQPPAILFVHGWHGDCDENSGGFTFAGLPHDLMSAMSADNHRIAGFNDGMKRWDCVAINWQDGVVANAYRLGSAVQAFRQELQLAPTHKVVLVAHSFGGLVSRYYLENLAGDEYVSRLIMLGTPNRGVPPLKVLPFLCRSLFGVFCTDQSLLDMVPDNVDALLNDDFTMGDTGYNVIIGDFGNFILPIHLLLGIPNDCVVNIASARGLSFPTYVMDDTLHAKSFIFGCAGPEEYFTHQPTKELVIDTLLNGGGAYATGPSANGLANLEPEPDFLNRASSITIDSLASTQIKTQFISVEPGLSGIEFTLLWADSAEETVPALSWTLKDPNGISITDGQAGVIHDVATSPGLGYLMYDIYSIENPMPGSWTVEVTSSADSAFAVLALPDSNITLTAQLDNPMPTVGEDVLLTTQLAENGSPLSGISAMAEVVKPDGTAVTLPLHDDGLGGDLLANDNIFSATLTPDNCGKYLITVTADGLATSNAVTRQQILTLQAHNNGYVLGDVCTGKSIFLPFVSK